jgi:putative zinc finger protein
MSADASVPHPLHPLDSGGHPSRLALGRLLAGECDPAARAALESHIASCAHCGRVFENARLDAEDFSRRRPTLESLARPRSRASGDARGWARKLLQALDRGFGMGPGMAGLAGLAVLVLASVIGVLQWRGMDGRESQASDLNAKGGVKFLAYLNGNPRMGDTLACAPKDTLQLLLVADAPVHYAVLFRDDGGPLMPYMASEQGSGAPVGSPRGAPLPHSLILGEGWARETVYCVSSPRSFTLIEAERAVALADHAEEGPESGRLRVQVLFLVNTAADGKVNGGP